MLFAFPLVFHLVFHLRKTSLDFRVVLLFNCSVVKKRDIISKQWTASDHDNRWLNMHFIIRRLRLSAIGSKFYPYDHRKYCTHLTHSDYLKMNTRKFQHYYRLLTDRLTRVSANNYNST